MMVKSKDEVKCRFSPDCLFFQEKMPNLPPLAEVFKLDFCMGNPEFCARHMLYTATGKDFVPDDLLPYEIERIKDVL